MYKIAYTLNGLIGGFGSVKNMNLDEGEDYDYQSSLTLKYCSKFLKKYVLENNDVDIFIFSWQTEKEKEFIESVFVYKDGYKNIIDDFCDYWCESNSDSENSLMRFEKCDVFDVKKRLMRWEKNSETFNSRKNTMPDFYDLAYINRIKEDSAQLNKFYKHLTDNCNYERKETLTGGIKWIKG